MEKIVSGRRNRGRGRHGLGPTKNGKLRTPHTTLPGLREFLLSLIEWEEVQSAVPGRIKSTSRGSYPTFRIQSETISGLKCAFRTQGGFQEVFLVTGDKTALRARLRTATFDDVCIELGEH